MPRRARHYLWAESACYHLVNRGHNRNPLFFDNQDRQAFLNLVARYQKRFGLRLYHYCLMDNHFHLLVQLLDPRCLSRLMAGLGVAYVHHYHRRYGFVGHLFQGRFKSPVIERDNYLLSCGRYLERNPLAAGLVQVPWDYRWSSCRAYALGESNRLLSVNPCYEELAKTGKRRQELWQAFLMDFDSKEEEVQRMEGLLGAGTFAGRLEDWQGRRFRCRTGRPSGGGKGPVSI
jgi:putative transposase